MLIAVVDSNEGTVKNQAAVRVDVTNAVEGSDKVDRNLVRTQRHTADRNGSVSRGNIPTGIDAEFHAQRQIANHREIVVSRSDVHVLPNIGTGRVTYKGLPVRSEDPGTVTDVVSINANLRVRKQACSSTEAPVGSAANLKADQVVLDIDVIVNFVRRTCECCVCWIRRVEEVVVEP